MKARDAIVLLATAAPGRDGAWADFGAGDGTFTRALRAVIGSGSTIYAVDRDAHAVAELERWSSREAANVVPVRADFTVPFELPGLRDRQLDGMLLANSLHFVRAADAVLARLAGMLRPGGRAIVVEYDRRTASPWVPFPISPARLAELAVVAGLGEPIVTATRPSRYGGVLYVATADRPE